MMKEGNYLTHTQKETAKKRGEMEGGVGGGEGEEANLFGECSALNVHSLMS